jgi:hypothetical protein
MRKPAAVAEIAATLHFDEDSHTYRVGGQVWPSVTQVLDPLLELDGIPRAALEAAAQFGNHVHIATDLWDKGVLDIDALDPHLRPYLDGWRAFLLDTSAHVIDSELRVMHPRLRYCGTLDKIVRMGKSSHVLDVKTSAVVPWTVGMQTAAYRDAAADYTKCRDRLSTTRLCVHLKDDGRYRLHKYSDTRDLNNFISCLNVHHLRIQHGR